MKNTRLTPIDENDIANNIKLVKINHITEALTTILPMLFTNIELAGFSISLEEDEEDDNIKDSALIVESIRSLLCKIHFLEHPFQRLADDVFKKTENLDELSMSEKLNITLYEKGDSVS
jgi:hypothetical protein